MRPIVVALLVALVPLAAAAEEDGWDRARRWTWYDVSLQTAFTALAATDWAQTSAARADGRNEANVLLGRRPGQDRINLTIGGAILGHALVSHVLPRPLRTYWQCLFIAMEGIAVQNNRTMGIGVRFPF